MKRNKLYTVNKWNAPLFVSDDKNLFWDGGTWYDNLISTPNGNSISNRIYNAQSTGVTGQTAPAPVVGNNGLSYTPYNGIYDIYQPIQPSTNINTSLEGTNINPTGKQKFKGTMTNVKNKLNSAFQKGGAGWMAAGAAAGMLGQVGNDPRGMWDTLDPVYHLAGGRESKAGNAMSDAGVSLTQAGLSSGNGGLMIAGAAAKVLGGLTNAAFGIKTNKERLNGVNQGIASNKNFISTAQDWDELRGADSIITNSDVYKGGWFSGGKARKKNRKLQDEIEAAKSWADRSIDNNMYNIADDYMNNYLASYHAFGGPLGGYTPTINGAIDYGFMSDYLLAKKKQADAKDAGKNLLAGMPNNAFAEGGKIEIKHPGRLTELKKRTGKTEAELWSEGNPDVRKMITFARNARKWKKAYGGFLESANNLFALGGDVQTHGADFTTGMTHVNAGGSHEENPYEGVQFGVDGEGKPNLVEEGETVYNDYVFSTRIMADAQTKLKFRLPRKKDFTFADISKKLEKESSERPNDPYSQDSLDKMLAKLANEQERQKTEMQAAQALEMFESMPPEEQVALMQQAAQGEAMAQQQAMQEAQMAEQAQLTPSQQGIDMNQLYDEGAGYTEPQMSAYGGLLNQYGCGGKVNKYDGGGSLRERLYNDLGLATDSAFNAWAEKNKLNATAENLADDAAWLKFIQTPEFLNAIRENHSPLAHAISTGKYDYGLYKPNYTTATITDPNNGKWGDSKLGGIGWRGSKDLAYLELVQKHGQDAVDKMKLPEFEKAMMETEAYKNTSEWLKNDKNALLYLNTIINGKDFDEDAKRYARQFVDENGQWRKTIRDKKTKKDRDFTYNYNDVFGRVRSTYPGSYWHSVQEAQRKNNILNFVQNENGDWEQIVTDVPEDYVKLPNSYTWDTADGGLTYNYYRNPGQMEGKISEVVITPDGPKADVKKAEEQLKAIALNRRPEWYRQAGAAFPFIGLGLWGAGVGRPDKSGLDAALEISANQPGVRVPYKGVHNYLAPRKYDLWFEQNRQNANARATDAAIMNSSLPQSSRAAAQIANGYNALIADADLHQKAMAYNDALEEKKETFNRDTNKFNAEAFNKAMMAEAEQQGRNWQYRGNLAADIAKAKMEADAGWYNGLYGGLTALGNNLIGIGTENFRMNRVGEMAANGIFGNMSEKTPIASEYFRQIYDNNTGAYGGKLRRKRRGFTY